MSAQHCTHCGEEVPTGARYCLECGERVTEVSQEFPQTSSSTVGGSTSNGTALATITHLLPLVSWVLGPLIVYLIAEDAFVKENARNAINWQIMYTVYMLVSTILLVILIGALLMIVVSFLNLAFCIIAAVKASDGEAWEYPATPRII